VDLASLHATASASGVQKHEPSASVFLIGMRGTGKTYVGEAAASALGWKFLDADQYFEKKLNIGVRDFVHQKGWQAFRDAELDILKELATEKATGYIISLGGGIVETPAARELLKEYARSRGPVVYVARPIDEIIKYLNAESARPAYEEPIIDVYRRREPWFAEVSSHDFINPVGEITADALCPLKVAANRKEIARFFKHVTGVEANLAHTGEPGKRSYFLCLTYPDVQQAFPYIDELTEGVDALELRVDLLRSFKDYEKIGPVVPSIAYVSEQVAYLRRVTSLPIVFTVRTQSQGGAFPDNAEKEALALLNAGLRLGVEYLDVEISLPEKSIRELVAKKGTSNIIASWHDWSGEMKWNGPVVKEKYDIAARFGDIVKIVGKAETLQDNFTLYDFAANVSKQAGAKPLIAINMGGEGQMSRILNTTLTPVSHPLLPNKAAPGQLSFKQIQQALHLIGLSPARKFYLFGTPIAHSMSPTLHNTGFELLGLPHHYELLETKDVGEEIKLALTAPDFGGASVTIPYKLDIIPLLNELSPAAQAIGAVNTVVPKAIVKEDGSTGHILFGDNTDWLGIKASITQRLSSSELRNALVIGAGGTARAAIYALQDIGAKTIYLFNRTQSKAEELAKAFPDAPLKVVGSLKWAEASEAPNVIVSTVPASATSTSDEAAGALKLDAGVFMYSEGPAVVVDMAYKPEETPLLGLAKGLQGGKWATVPGIEVLLEQGYVQFELWTGRKCPRKEVSATVLAKYRAAA